MSYYYNAPWDSLQYPRKSQSWTFILQILGLNNFQLLHSYCIWFQLAKKLFHTSGQFSGPIFRTKLGPNFSYDRKLLLPLVFPPHVRLGLYKPPHCPQGLNGRPPDQVLPLPFRHRHHRHQI